MGNNSDSLSYNGKMCNPDDSSSGYTEELDSKFNKGLESSGSECFRNIEPIYISNSGSSMLCVASRFGKKYILKSLKESFRYNPIYRTALTKEFEIGIGLDHPNICRTIGLEEIEELGTTIVLEYIDGETLETKMERGDISKSNVRRIATQIAEALSYIHSKQVIHRDIKPSNIMLTHSGNVVKLIDFGLSDSESYLVIKTPAGTRSYMAPEQLAPGAKANAKTDIYSFGIILHDLAVATNDRRLLEISIQCTAKDPSKRPDSVEDLDINSINSGRDYLFSSFLSSKITTFVLSALILILIAIGTTAWNRRTERSETSMNQVSDSSGIEVMDSSLWPSGSE